MQFRDRLHRLAVFYECQDSTVRALGKNAKLRFFIGTFHGDDDAFTARCPQLPLYPNHDQIAALRGVVDACAVRSRYGVSRDWSSQYSSHQQQLLHEGMEQIRCEWLGGRQLFGVRHNLSRVRHNPLAKDVLSELLLFTRSRLCIKIHSVNRDLFDSALVDKIDALSDCCDNAEHFHQQVEGIALLLPELTDSTSPRLMEMDDADSDDKNETSSLHLVDQQDSTIDGAELKSESGLENNSSGYAIFNSKHDQIVDATDLLSSERLVELRRQLDRKLRASRVSLSYLASRLLHVLSSYQLSDWERDHDEGHLDVDCLDQLIVDPLYPRAHQQKKKQANRDTMVCLMIDNSGSMRGHPVMVAALCADMLSRTLERCGVSNEVLGYTTRYWRGGEIRDQWRNEGAPKNPGRLNALRHIVYKSAERSWRKSRLGFGQMLDEEMLKENIDGEALEWAFKRLSARPEARKILIVISDGAPRDEATNQANGDGYLTRHLQQVISTIQRRSEIDLLAIGVGHDVSAFYHHAIVIPDEITLGDTLVDQLCAMLSTGNKSAMQQSRSSSVWSGATRNIVSL